MLARGEGEEGRGGESMAGRGREGETVVPRREVEDRSTCKGRTFGIIKSR